MHRPVIEPRPAGRRTTRAGDTKDPPLATRTELSDFLAGVERRAYKQALFAVRDDEAALDIVQDAMMRLAEKYGGKPAEELPLLFQRILQNAIRDYYRRRKVRSLWTTLLSSLGGKREDDDSDPLETLEAEAGPTQEKSPDEQLEQAQLIEIIEKETQEAACASTRSLPPSLLGGIRRCRNRCRDGMLGGQRKDALLTRHARLGHCAQGEGH